VRTGGRRLRATQLFAYSIVYGGIALKHPDGSLTSNRLYAEKDGIKPPM
jgi:hypothetical protein